MVTSDVYETDVPFSVVTIDKLAFGGSGVCRIDGKVCFVPYSCPGDEVVLRMTAQKKSYCMAAISEIVIPSSWRVVPVCTIFGVCGGCSWQHISYSCQLVHKRNIMAEILWRGARVPADLIEDVVAATLPYGYRNRTQFKVSDRNGKLLIGFFRKGSHEVEDAPHGCAIAAPPINQVLSDFKSILRKYPDIGSVYQLSIDSGDNDIIVIIYHKRKITSKSREYLIDNSKYFGLVTGLFLAVDSQPLVEKLWGSSDITYKMDRVGSDQKPVVLMYPPGSFAQVHQLQNNAMLNIIRRLGTFAPHEHLLDLYCGNGNFSLPLASEVASVTGIESNADSIRAADFNRELNKVANAQFFCDDVTTGLLRLVDMGRKFDTVLLDPPRSGAANVIDMIARLQPEKIVYVSCDPSTLARDCGLLTGCNYTVVKTVPIDMFPQTYHLESVTLLCRS